MPLTCCKLYESNHTVIFILSLYFNHWNNQVQNCTVKDILCSNDVLSINMKDSMQLKGFLNHIWGIYLIIVFYLFQGDSMIWSKLLLISIGSMLKLDCNLHGHFLFHYWIFVYFRFSNNFICLYGNYDFY